MAFELPPEADTPTVKSAEGVSAVADATSTGTDAQPAMAAPKKPKGVRFWLVFIAICLSLFLSALEFTAVSTALPTIAHDLNGVDFVWIASAYSLAATALLPATGGMAQVFGRRPCMMIALAVFALGSALCGAAQSMNWLIAARGKPILHRAGGGSILAITGILMSDLVSLAERGTYNGFIATTWAFAMGMGPIVGGALAEHGQWRWIFYLNLPLTGLAAILIMIFLNVRTPHGSFWDKFRRMDWMGNALAIGSSSAVVIALTWGGVQHPWSSAQILAPLIIGLVGLLLFLVYEAFVAKQPLVPIVLLSNRTSFSGYVQNFINPVLTVGLLYFMPAFYQASWGASPIRSGVLLFGFVLMFCPFPLLCGLTVSKTGMYRVQLWLGWAAYIAGFGVLSTLDEHSDIARATGGLVILGFGAALIYSASYFPVLAPLPISQNAYAMAFFQFCRSFAAVWGVTVGTAVLQTQLTKRLPKEFVDSLPGGVSIAYSVIPVIPTLSEPLRTQVRVAFADSIRVLWQVTIGIAGLGALGSLLMEGLPLQTHTDETWGIEDKAKGQGGDEEKGEDTEVVEESLQLENGEKEKSDVAELEIEPAL
ncbi:MFS general substrate transporter [Phanerochaete sordida]|uniref:MFS general substrate transporter n=1 Tax=Phanerochaete sordida TaxID=48140 RepID=A0A9P3G4E3_9APHY|nr:MFS general substrate transporter [Phanerochaete sordida]